MTRYDHLTHHRITPKKLREAAAAYCASCSAPDSDDMFSLEYQWQDKKHRHVYDLCGLLRRAADKIEKLEAKLADG